MPLQRSEAPAKGEKSVSERYFLTSLTDVETLAYAVRSHQSIENGLQSALQSGCWTLDVAFRGDASRARTQNAQANLVTLRRLALNQLKQESSLKASVKAKRSRAGWDDDYLLKVLHA